jgi:starch synthase
MTNAPRILFVAPELAPWAKAGGLGEVARDLPRALAQAGAEVRLLVPAYRELRSSLPAAREIARFESPGGVLAPARLCYAEAEPPILLLQCDAYYARPGGAYGGADGADWPDNHLRFGLLSRVAAILGSAASPLDWRPEVVHCNDWPGGLAPAWLAHAPGRRAASVMTVHNLAYQGLFPRSACAELALPEEAFAPEGVEFHGRLSFLKAGLHYATQLTTVSATYAQEIQQPELGCGLDGLLRRRAGELRGIPNGIDTAIWDPARDPHLASRYDAARLEAKAPNKAALQRELGLRADPAAPLLGMVGRLVEQKGADLVIAAAPELLRAGAQLAVLGRGERRFEQSLLDLAARHPGALAARIEYSEPLAHRIEAGADLFLMPSRFEPCGLNQLYSMRYGTPPVVRRTGGLADSVTDAADAALREGSATGFVFDEPSPGALLAAAGRALAAWRDPARWVPLQRAGMARDSGWARPARDYLEVYRLAAGEAASVVSRKWLYL